MTNCQAHKDKEASLCISEGKDGKILCHCFAGCKIEDILSAVGLSIKDVSDYKELTCFNKITWFYANKYEWTDSKGKQHKGYGDGVKIVAEYRYYDESGKYLYSKLRLEGGRIEGMLIRFYHIDIVNDTATSMKPSETPHVLYRLREFIQYRHKAEYVYIVEGEKDCEKLRQLGEGFGCCTTSGGASSWRAEFAKYFKGLKIIILRDNDQAGLQLAETIENDLRNIAYQIKIVNPSSLDHGDVTDYLTKEGGTAESLKQLCNQEKGRFANWVNINKDGTAGSINTGILTEVLSENEQYIIIRNPIDDKDMFFRWNHGVYEQINRNGIKAIIREYLPSNKVTDAALNNVANLLLATEDNVHRIEELDSDDRYINFRNGLLDRSTKELIAHKTELLSTLQYAFEYNPDNNNHPVFDKFIRDLCTKYDGSVDEDEIKQIQEYCGFLISNISMSRIKKALVLWSRQGDTGKSALIRLISSLIQNKLASIKLTELTPDNKFILGTLPYCRLISCGDESNSNVKDSSIFKSITGGDALKVEAKGKQGFTYTFRGGFIIACNGLPFFADDHGNHLFDRLMILPCEHHIDERIKDTSIEDKMQKELPAIMNWCLEGLYRLVKNGYEFTHSKSSDRAKEEYHLNMDNVYRFVMENYVITRNYDDRIAKKDFDDAYHLWASNDTSIKEVDRKNLSARLEAIGITNSMGNVGDKRNVTVYRGITIKPPEKNQDGFTDIENTDSIDDLPFD